MDEYGMNEFELIKKADVMRIINAENAVVLNNLKERSTDEVLVAIASQINGLQTTNRWIPCSERMPAEFEDVLVVYLDFMGEKHITEAYMEDEENAFDWRSTWNGDVIDAKVTHWMPLPDAPKEEGGPE